MQTGQYELQSYFKSLCNSFYIAYRQLKKLKKEAKARQEEIERINALLEGDMEEKVQNSGFAAGRSKEELQKEKEKLEAIQREYPQQRVEWKDRMDIVGDWIEVTVREITRQGGSVIITSEAEIYALMSLYSNIVASSYPIINQGKEGKKVFPTGKKVYEEFLEAYQCDLLTTSLSSSKMPEIYNRYF